MHSIPSIPLLCLTRTAGAALAACRFITVAGVYPAAGAAALGVTRTTAAQGDLVPTDVMGTTAAEAGGAVALGPVKVDNQGRVLTWDAGVKVGIALNTAAAVGDPVEVFLIPNG